MTPAHAIRLEQYGSPDVMTLQPVTLAAPGATDVLVRHTAVGVNYIDITQRKGAGAIPLPSGLGFEAVGVVEAIGSDVGDFRVGDRVATMNAGVGAYADRRVVPSDKLVPVPAGISDEQVASCLFKGLTAQYLVKKTCPVEAGDLVIVHAAAGGVGQILSRWARTLGAEVVGLVSSPAKCEVARAAGCDHALTYDKDDWPAAVLEATGGRKARVVYDSVGARTFLASLDLLAPFGMMVYYGAASGAALAFEPDLLNRKGCLFLTRPSVFPHNATRALLSANAADLFEAIAAGTVKVEVAARFALAEAAKAHAALESRSTAGAILLVP